MNAPPRSVIRGGSRGFVGMVSVGLLSVRQKRSNYHQKDNGKFDFPEPKIVKNVFTYENVTYDSVSVE